MSCFIGNMNEKITLLQQVETTDATNGSVTSTYTTLATVWAERVVESAKESVIRDKMTLDTTITLKIRYRTDLSSNYRVTYRSEQYRIVSIKELERKTSMELKIAILD